MHRLAAPAVESYSDLRPTRSITSHTSSVPNTSSLSTSSKPSARYTATCCSSSLGLTTVARNQRTKSRNFSQLINNSRSNYQQCALIRSRHCIFRSSFREAFAFVCANGWYLVLRAVQRVVTIKYSGWLGIENHGVGIVRHMNLIICNAPYFNIAIDDVYQIGAAPRRRPISQADE